MIERIPWSGEVDAALISPAGAQCVPLLRAEVKSGASKLWRCTSGSSIAYIVTRVDENPRELVIAYVEGRNVAAHAEAFIAAARKQKVPMRIHTTSPATARWLRRFGLQLSEYVLRLPV
jgi:beta-phosphoglucomutase-like phosphatase (HAD superfamily)